MEWTAVVLSTIGIIFNVKQRRICFLLWLVANVLWIIVDVEKGLYGQAALFVLYTGISIWGWFDWKKKGLPLWR